MPARTPRPSSDTPAAQRAQLAAVVIEQLQSLDDLGEDAAIEEVRASLRRLGDATLQLALAANRNLAALSELDRQFELLGAILDVPNRLGAAGETALVVRVAEALKFVAPDDMNGQIAHAYAQAGERQRALELVATNLETARKPFIAEFRAGDVYRELDEADAAEAYYRRALALANTAGDRSEVSLRIASLLIDTGRETDAVAFLAQQRAEAKTSSSSERPAPTSDSGSRLPKVSRNEPCPCGSGKKYK